MIETYFAVADNVESAIAFVTGAGGAAGVLYMWIRSLLKENESMSKRLNEEADKREELIREVLLSIQSLEKVPEAFVATARSIEENIKKIINDFIEKTIQ